MDEPKLLRDALVVALRGGNLELSNSVINVLLHDIAWIIHTVNTCKHEECLEEKTESVIDVLKLWIDEFKEGKQRLDMARATEIADAAVARALRRE